MSQPDVTSPAEKVFGYVSLTIIVLGGAYVIVRNTVAKRRWVARWAAQLILIFAISLATRWLIVLMGFRGRWVQYAGLAVGFAVGSSLIAPLSLGDWNQLRRRDIPSDVKRKVIERHKRLTGSYDPAREHIDHI
jgi:hypothetical protein